jgi:hypothetical protein
MVSNLRRLQHVACAALLASGSVLGAPGVAFAKDTEAAAGADGEAEALVERGITYRRNGEDAEALPLFQRAEQLAPESTRVKVHLAATYQALGQWEAADRYLTRALEDPTDVYIQKHQATLAAARRTIDAHIAQLRILGDQPGVEVRLNGRLIGELPIAETVRIEAGIYTLEAHLDGYYPITRSVALAGGAFVRETVELTPRSEAPPSPAAVASPKPEASSAVEADVSKSPSWITWTLAGLAVGGAAVTVAAWISRENHADTWNDDDQCQGGGQTRGQLCGEELDAGQTAETWMWIGGASAVAFTGAAIGSYLWLDGPSQERPLEAGVRCGIGLAQLSCSGRF